MNIYFFIFIILVGFTGYAFYRTRKKNPKHFPLHWHNILITEVDFYRLLSAKEQVRFQKRMMQFLSEVYIDSVNLDITEIDTILIAVSGVIPVFAFKDWHYTKLSGVILYPDSFNEDFEFAKDGKDRRIAGMVGSGRLEKQMILSKKALHHGFKNDTDKRNTAIHEFVHLIDKMDDKIDGIPEILMHNSYAIPWLKLVHDKMETINMDKSDIRAYGGTKQSEFFAVASEYFFEEPKLMKRKHPELYKMMSECFRLKV